MSATTDNYPDDYYPVHYDDAFDDDDRRHHDRVFNHYLGVDEHWYLEHNDDGTTTVTAVDNGRGVVDRTFTVDHAELAALVARASAPRPETEAQGSQAEEAP